MNYAELKKNDIANGYGVRVSLFVSGCTHHCPGCFNEIAWDFAYGRPFNDDAVAEVLAALAPDFVNGLSLLGGEPFEPDNQRGLLPLIRAFQQLYPHKDIWCYTGYVYDRDLCPAGAPGARPPRSCWTPSTCWWTGHSSRRRPTSRCCFAAAPTSACWTLPPPAPAGGPCCGRRRRCEAKGSSAAAALGRAVRGRKM